MHIFVPRTDKYTEKMQNNTKQRQQAILDILRSGAVYSQEELALRLKDEGIASTQATLSRDLRALRISKVPGEGYVIPTEGHSVFTDLSAGALRIQFSGNLAVIKTRPGLDHHMIYPVIGTIAGDDTILLVVRAGVSSDDVLDALTPLFPAIKNRLVI